MFPRGAMTPTSSVPLSLEFKWVGVIALFFFVAGLAVSRLVNPKKPPLKPTWFMRYGRPYEAWSLGVAMIALFAASIWVTVRSVEPVMGALIFIALGLALFFKWLNAMIELGHQRAWVWAIRHGDVIRLRAFLVVIAVIGLAIAVTLVKSMLQT